MNSFLVRIELHSATYEDYNMLHRLMEREGFSRYVVDGTTGVQYHLPTAEYIGTSNLSAEQIRTKISNIASRTNKTFGILVAQTIGALYWQGLQQT